MSLTYFLRKTLSIALFLCINLEIYWNSEVFEIPFFEGKESIEIIEAAKTEIQKHEETWKFVQMKK